MASAPDSEVKVELPGADDGGLDMGFGGGGEDERWFWGRREEKAKVLSRGIEDCGEGGVGLSVDGLEEWEGFVGILGETIGEGFLEGEFRGCGRGK